MGSSVEPARDSLLSACSCDLYFIRTYGLGAGSRAAVLHRNTVWSTTSPGMSTPELLELLVPPSAIPMKQHRGHKVFPEIFRGAELTAHNEQPLLLPLISSHRGSALPSSFRCQMLFSHLTSVYCHATNGRCQPYCLCKTKSSAGLCVCADTVSMQPVSQGSCLLYFSGLKKKKQHTQHKNSLAMKTSSS